MEMLSGLTEFHLDWKEGVSIILDSRHGFADERARKWTSEHWNFFCQMSILYFVFVFGTKFIMRNQKPFDLQLPLNAWNAFLAVFSTAGAIFMAPEFFETLFGGGFRASYCTLGGMSAGQNGFWMWLFVLSKLFEFVDTGFIILRKKPLMFLHWYHHILTLLYCVYSFPHHPAYNRWAAFLNLSVHSFMYSYYFLRSIRVPIPGFVAKGITTGQILQFVISIFVLACRGFEEYILGWKDCSFHAGSFWFISFMDMTYLVLFVNFFLQSYVVKGGKAKYATVTKEHEKKKE